MPPPIGQGLREQSRSSGFQKVAFAAPGSPSASSPWKRSGARDQGASVRKAYTEGDLVAETIAGCGEYNAALRPRKASDGEM